VAQIVYEFDFIPDVYRLDWIGSRQNGPMSNSGTNVSPCTVVPFPVIGHYS